jgi:thiamine biosynthesis protein ThiS
MKLQLNGAQAEYDSPLTISDLLVRLKPRPETVVVEYNLQVPPKDSYGQVQLHEGDRLEIVKFMGGG